MNFKKIKLAIYSLILTNWYGFKLKGIKSPREKKQLRIRYAQKMMAKLDLVVEVRNPEKIPAEGQYLVLANHRAVIDPVIVELALAETELFGLWIAKKELYNSPFFGLFVRNAGAILLDREQSQMRGFFSEIKSAVKEGNSIFIFPEGTRNKSEKSLLDFKEGFRIIALKNRLPILPIYIETHSDKALDNTLNNKPHQTISIVVGDLIDYKEKANIEGLYKGMFKID
ncbi:MAG: lysophospholipid acyltransferase family protein [Thiomicrorhabdus sp.]|jgi:1-acyl-sn-glycerol-3-phosphate acyltransferase|nr:lysophospholipid acyltransferase family protein [Thiomicrorhabdus sp.]